MRDGYIKSMREHIGHDRLLIAGAGGDLYRDGRVLLQLRADNHLWSDCGGAVEIGEEPEEAARRELFEETGITAGRLELLGVYGGDDMMFTYPNGDEVYIIGVYFSCEDFSGEVQIDPDEVEGLRWFELDALPPDEQICRTVRKSLHDFVSRKKAELAGKNGAVQAE